MSEPAKAVTTDQPTDRAAKLVSELRVTGHLMTLEPGLFCIILAPCKGLDQGTGLPGVRISPPPGLSGRPELVSIRTFREDGWLYGIGDVATVRVSGAAAQVLVTVYQAPDAAEGTAPNLQVVRLEVATDLAPLALPPPPPQAVAPAPVEAPAAGAGPIVMDMVAHIQTRGDVGAKLGTWLGDAGSKLWIEGFAVAPETGVAMSDIEYQAVLGRGWLSPWVEGGQYCGSRGMALPVLGLRLRLRGAAAEAFDCTYSATFLDGTAMGPVKAGEPCESESLAPMESFRIDIFPRGKAPAQGAQMARGGTAQPTVKSAAPAQAAAPAVKAPAPVAKAKAAAPVAKPVRGKAAAPAPAKPAPKAAARPAPKVVAKAPASKAPVSKAKPAPAAKAKAPPPRRR